MSVFLLHGERVGTYRYRDICSFDGLSFRLNAAISGALLWGGGGGGGGMEDGGGGGGGGS